jgi:hypothetical protein
LGLAAFAGAALRALLRLADFPFGSFPRFCTFEAFLRLAIDCPLLSGASDTALTQHGQVSATKQSGYQQIVL